MRVAIGVCLAVLTGVGCAVEIGAAGDTKAPLGARCSASEACASGLCLLEAPEPVCSAPCATASQCPAGFACGVVAVGEHVNFACVADTDSSVGGSCASGSDCASRLCFRGRCTEPCLVCGEAAACVATDLEVDGRSIEAPICQVRRAAPSLVLGPVATSSTGGSEVVELEVPSGLASFVLVLRAEGGARVGITRLEGPGGTAVIDVQDDAPDANPMAPYIEMASALVPSSDLVRPSPGRWRFEVGTFDPAVFDALEPVAGTVASIDVVFEPEAEVGGTLDLHLGLADAFGLTSTTATASPFVRDVLAQVERGLLEPAALELGAIEVSILAPEHDRVEDGDETRDLCRHRARPGPNGTSLNLFIVGDLAYTSGHAGGTPGPPGVFDTAASCVVAERLRSGRDTGILAAHEIGHFLGLRHTTELDGTPDPLTDTPVCPSQTDVRSCPDYRNLMFPRFPLDPNLSLTPNQIAVIRSNPMLWE